MWSRDGSQLFYRNGDQVMVVDVESTDPTFVTRGPARELFRGPYTLIGGGGGGSISYDVAADGRLVMLQPPEMTSSRINVVPHWFEELKRLLPGS